MVGNKFGKGLLPWNAGKPRPEIRGANHPRWKGGIGRHGRDIEKSRFEYKEWRRKVFERDDYTCQKCSKKGEYLQADHIKEWTDYPGLRYVVSNGQTLCLKCHRSKTSDYMKGNGNARKN
jgi:5-methylcytosine-specific restriction endonuclease McrA